jgi:ubiquinol-cytochrome c reductase cytochrome b/c1 subunit
MWSGQNNPTGIEVKSKTDTVPFTPYYTVKDGFAMVVFLIGSSPGSSSTCRTISATRQLHPANPLVTPAHIVPEWYYLPFYAILRAIGSARKPAEGWYIPAMQVSTLYYFAFFLIIMPVLGLIETPKPLPNSITEAVLEKNKGGSGHPVGAAAEPQTKG